MTCHVLNGGRNSTGHLTHIKSTSTDPNSGFLLELYLPKDYLVYYFINDAYVKPTTSETTNITYRQVNCFVLFFQKYVQKYALEHEIGEDKAKKREEVKNYDTEKRV